LRKLTLNSLELAVALLLLGLGALVLVESLRLGPGWSFSGPEPGFFPFIMTILLIGGALGILYMALRRPDRRPCFEAREEWVNLALVGAPILVAILAMQWLGLYLVAGIYLALFMIWYGRFNWLSGLVGGAVLMGTLWFVLSELLVIPMPMSLFYRAGMLPF
jgi:hypothetical protein